MRKSIITLLWASLVFTVPMFAQSTIATIPVGLSPHSVAVSPNGDVVYVVNRDSNDVSVIDIASLEVTQTIAVGDRPEGVAFSPDGAFAYVVNDRSENISVIDVAGGFMMGSIFIPDPQGIAVTSDGAFAYVTQSGQGGRRNSVSIVDLGTGAIVTTLPNILPRPRAIALTWDDTLAYVVNRESNHVTAIRDSAVSGTIPVGMDPRDVAFYPDGTLAYVTNHDSSTISVIDTASDTVVDTFTGILRPEGIDLTSDGAYAAVAGGEPDHFLFLVDLVTLEVVGQAPIGLNPERVAITPDDLLAFVANRGSNTVSCVQLF